MAVIVVEENDNTLTLVLKDVRNVNGWLIYSIVTIVETLDADYEDIDSLYNLDVTNTVRCGKYVKNCALQNGFKIYNWESQLQKKIYQV